MKKFPAFCLGLAMSLVACAQQKDTGIHEPENVNYTVETVVDGLSVPWGMAFLPDGSMLITERSGELIHFRNGEKININNVPEVYARGQGGFMDIKLHPGYKENGWIYLSYSSPEGEEKGAHTAVIRAKLKGNDLVEKQLLYKATPNTGKSHHFGSRFEFDRDGYLYFSIGERGDRDINPQDITRDGGKIYRLKDDGSIPSDNPFTNKPGAKHAIYSYGHRNPQGMAIHPETGEIWIHEHGPRGGDEINIIKKGANYGWPVITYGINYSGTTITDETEKEGMEQPLYYWVPSIAPSGMAFVTSDIYPDWKNNLLAGSLSFQYLERLVIRDNKVTYREKLLPGIGRVRDVRQGPDGYIYVSVEGKGIVKIVPQQS
ncbi:PQQ-dependent sugar dehydrogenase [Sinomicrobium weinanense]|uniref:PQQ-dependent sugar dehydrogenase n=1 Tax=Sinomicrobium weinanense TaxID=2842200 RepID=A0A926Q0D6_9FLAO|nr:PQQ-dependent sugar dehydrogenase [Sinomicrobium weinanense]MBC9794827.1 PQQ-dependent sugar dehydrogenase [Sinomicrobium weinanense]MBU3125086.1 PQQ-dependent sugar dehydrogenase [Sinomicrobium weinanense]